MFFSDSSFHVFYEKFKTDSLFQISRVKFPLEGQYESYEEEKTWSREEWQLMNWDFRTEMNNSDDSITITQNQGQFFYGTYSKECGFSFEMEFKKNGGEWYLTYRQENNF